ncbi:uncharacterized protein LOC110051945 [Orbicella faveolata]|uniref:uncharacterized protein LOC110051945 n=1 Tax=Orbicella faveolata TaxID=48498 RepID=UPI0009E376F2|nr:uncharacterized protein LOC110051945 [Orbicella faveolata]
MNDQVEEGKAKAAGIVGILIGVIALIELICGFIYLSKGGPEGSGLWSGVGLAVIAALGIVTWLKRNKTALVFYLVMCILWFIVCIIQVIIAFIAWAIWHIIRKVVETNCDQIGDTCVCHDTDNTPITVHNCDDIRTIESIFLCILIMSAFAAILTLSGSIIGCMGTCCARPAVSHAILL